MIAVIGGDVQAGFTCMLQVTTACKQRQGFMPAHGNRTERGYGCDECCMELGYDFEEPTPDCV